MMYTLINYAQRLLRAHALLIVAKSERKRSGSAETASESCRNRETKFTFWSAHQFGARAGANTWEYNAEFSFSGFRNFSEVRKCHHKVGLIINGGAPNKEDRAGRHT
jgi:hypothetical protein